MFHGWWIVITVFTVQLFMVGFMSYGYGLLLVPVEEEFQCGMEKMHAGAMASAMMGIFLPLAVGPLVDRWSVRGLLLIGIGALVGGLLALSLAPDWFFWAVVMATIIATGQTLLGPIVGQAAVARWFTASRGRALGIAAIGTSIGGIVMAPLFGLGFESIGWRSTLRMMAATVAVCALPLLLLVFRDRPSDVGLLPEGETSTPAAAGPRAAHPALMPVGEIVGQRSYWSVSVCLALFLGTYNAMLMNVPKFAAELGADASARSSLIVVLTVAGLIGKLVFGWIADRIPLRIALWTAIGLTATSVLLMSMEPEYLALCAAVAVMGLAAGGILPVWGALMAQLFGVANFGRAMGLQAPLISLGAMGGLWIAGRLYDRTGSYVLPFQIFAGVLGVAALVLLLLRMPVRAAGAGQVAATA